MYKKAHQGSITQFTGLSASFKEPVIANIVVNMGKNDVEDCLKQIMKATRI